ncbi:MAG: NAD-dependent epimerase/dehydratase family protein [Candidatus Lokiarchaeia archaeon]|nr:NAD-dependent epimerase/dehydratase family protein [Candidatus Lokiarchaeia archaeon]
MANILITGGTGFIGVPLVKNLYNLGHNLKLLIRKKSNTEPFQDLNNIEYVIGDIRDLDILSQATNNIDIIYHLAANTQIWSKDKSIYEEININGSENIAKVALEKNILLIFISSFFAIGPYNCGEKPPEFETHERNLDFFMDYEKSKCDSTKLIQEYKEKGLKTIIFYPGFVYGPGDLNFYGKLTIDLILGKLLGIPKTSVSKFSMAYIYDIVEPMINVIGRNELIGNEYFLGGETVSTIDYFDSLAKIAGVKKPRKFPLSIALLYGRLCELRAKISKNRTPYITCALMKMSTYDWAYSSQKAIEDLGYAITPFKEGLEKTVEWYMDYIEKGKK